MFEIMIISKKSEKDIMIQIIEVIYSLVSSVS